MQRLIWWAVAVLVSLAAAPRARAQAEEERPIRVGAGAGVNLGSITLFGDAGVSIFPLGLAGLHVPIRFSGTFMLEPEVGFFTISEDRPNSSSTSSAVRLGLGAFYLIDLAEATNGYVGLRGGTILASDDSGSDGTITQESSQTNFFIGLAVGGEYYLSPSFSLGAEVDFTFLSLGNPTTTQAGEEIADSESTATVVSTSTLLLIRWFFL